MSPCCEVKTEQVDMRIKKCSCCGRHFHRDIMAGENNVDAAESVMKYGYRPEHLQRPNAINEYMPMDIMDDTQPVKETIKPEDTIDQLFPQSTESQRNPQPATILPGESVFAASPLVQQTTVTSDGNTRRITPAHVPWMSKSDSEYLPQLDAHLQNTPNQRTVMNEQRRTPQFDQQPPSNLQRYRGATQMSAGSGRVRAIDWATRALQLSRDGMPVFPPIPIHLRRVPVKRVNWDTYYDADGNVVLDSEGNSIGVSESEGESADASESEGESADEMDVDEDPPDGDGRSDDMDETW